jgi:phosphoglycolate phosphatase
MGHEPPQRCYPEIARIMIRHNRKFDPRSIRLLIFDLDGTLIDSRLDLIHTVNATLRHLGRPQLPGDVIASYVGDGAPMLVRRALGDPEDEELVRRALDFFLAYYREHKLDHTHVYAGVLEALASICESPNGHTRKLAVLSNKPVNPSRAIVEAVGLGQYFAQVYGGNSFSTKKPDPLGAKTILHENACQPREAVIVGDSSNDILTGRNAGLWTVGVTYGFAPQSLELTPPDALVDSPKELAELFL